MRHRLRSNSHINTAEAGKTSRSGCLLQNPNQHHKETPKKAETPDLNTLNGAEGKGQRSWAAAPSLYAPGQEWSSALNSNEAAGSPS